MTRNTGFTIIELMLTIAVAGVLLAVGVPSFVNMTKNNCLTNKTNSLISAFQIARSTAITERNDIILAAKCMSDTEDNNGVADGSCATGDEYGPGVVVFRDIDGDNLADSEANDVNGDGDIDEEDFEIIRVIDFTCAATIDETANRTSFTYQADGTTTLAAGTTGFFNICDDRASSEYTGRRITVNAIGRPHAEADFTCP